MSGLISENLHTAIPMDVFSNRTIVTVECKVLYSQDQVVEKIPEGIVKHYYPEEDGSIDFHTMYVGEIVDAYIIK